MGKKIYFQQFTIAMALILIILAHGTATKRGDDLIASIKTNINQLKALQAESSDVEQVNSPALQKEHEQILKAIINDAKQLDNFIKTLPSTEQRAWQNKQSEILEPAKNMLKGAIAENITATWQQQGKAIAQTALDIVIAGVGTAAINLVIQGLKIGTGNLTNLDTNTLLLAGLTSTSAAALTALTKNRSTFLPSTSASALSEALIAPCMISNSYAIAMPSFTGPITYWLTTEAIEIATAMLEKSGGISKMLGNIDLNKTIIPGWSKQIGAPSNILVEAALPTVQAVVRNQKIASVLTEVGWIVIQSAAVGGLVHMAGFGYADTTMISSVGNAVLTGVAQGTLSAVLTLAAKTSPGAIVNITTASVVQKALLIGGETSQASATAIIQTTLKEVSNLFLDESKKQGGLLQTLQKGKELLGQTIRSRWSSTWATITDAWATIQSIEPLRI